MIKNFNDLLAVFAFLVIIPLLWILKRWFEGIPIDATIVVWTLIGNYYFRKRMNNDGK